MTIQKVLFNQSYKVSQGTEITLCVDYNSNRGTRNPSFKASLQRTNSETIDWAFFQIYETRYDDGTCERLALDKPKDAKCPFCSYFEGTGMTRQASKIFSDCPKDNLTKPGVLRFTTFFAIIDTMCRDDFVKWYYNIKIVLIWGLKHRDHDEMCPIEPSEGLESDFEKLKDLLATEYCIHSLKWDPVQ